MTLPTDKVHSNRVKNFDELDNYLGGTGGVNFLDKRYLNVDNEETVAKIKQYAKEILQKLLEIKKASHKFRDHLMNKIGYTDALIAKYGILMVASRRRLDKENPHSIISTLEQKLSNEIKSIMKAQHLSESSYWAWMTIFSYPSQEGGECHPWIYRYQETLGAAVVDMARRVRSILNLYRSATLRWIRDHLGEEATKDLQQLVERIQSIHFWSEKDEREETEDLAFTNMVVDNFCPHHDEHRSLVEIRECRSVKKYLEPKRFGKMKLALYILADDYVGSGRKLRALNNLPQKSHGAQKT